MPWSISCHSLINLWFAQSYHHHHSITTHMTRGGAGCWSNQKFSWYVKVINQVICGNGNSNSKSKCKYLDKYPYFINTIYHFYTCMSFHSTTHSLWECKKIHKRDIIIIKFASFLFWTIHFHREWSNRCNARMEERKKRRYLFSTRFNK